MSVTPVFERSFSFARGVEGMMSEFSMQVMDSVLQFQREAMRPGHLVEFGVYKGKSATVIGFQARPDERVILVDVERYIQDETLRALPCNAEFVLGRSEDFKAAFPEFGRIAGKVRFLHVDSSHAYRTTLAEMALADDLLAPHGILCLDDYANLNYSQLLPAIYKYLFTQRTDLTVFLVTNEKCYLCRRRYFPRYADFTLRRLLDEMQVRGAGAVTLARTDVDEEYSAFHCRESLSSDEGRRYGEAIYGRLYETAAPVKMRRRLPGVSLPKRGWLRRFLE
jgi:hypothetical protein